MSGYVVSGDFTIEELADALRQAFPGRKVSLAPGKIDTTANFTASGDIIVGKTDKGYHSLIELLDEKEVALKEAEEAATKAVVSIQALHKQQQALFDEFVLLRQRYDDQKQTTVNILWNQCAKFHPELRQIPPMEEGGFVENDDQIGHYIIGDLLGEGQFAAVKSCTLERNDEEFAIKMIKKERITSFTALTRVSNEIDNLRILKSPYVISVIQVIHTQNMLYLISERGGSDLFEFFDEHPDGVQESWAREIIGNVLKGVLYCHEQDICHRDLKPENILLTFDPRAGKCIDLKLCDFGLSTKFKSKQVLSDFCGSPGFFAPEMIIHGCYYGDKADVWSVGCILMELVLGHEKFCDVWMTAYDYDILQDKEAFTSTISEAVEHLPDFLNFSKDLNNFVMRFLELHSSRRPSIKSVASHPWLQGALDEELAAMSISRSLHSPASFSKSPSSSFSMMEASEVSSKIGHVSKDVIDAAYGNISDKERKQMEEYIQLHKNADEEDEVMHLPPITPATPSIHKAKKILRKGSELANTNYGNITVNVQPGGESHQQFQYMCMTPEANSPCPSAKNSFLSPVRSPLPSVAESYQEGGNNDLDQFNGTKYRQNSARANSAGSHSSATTSSSNSNYFNPSASSDEKPSLLVSHSHSKIWETPVKSSN